jgi:predicted transcriptional regulator
MSIVGFEMPADLREALERAARKDDRSLSSYVRRAVRDRLERDGVLPRASTSRRGSPGDVSGAAA